MQLESVKSESQASVRQVGPVAPPKAFSDKVLEQIQHLQQRVEDGLARVLHWAGLPNLIDIQAISRRLDEIQASIQELVAAGKPEPRARKTG